MSSLLTMVNEFTLKFETPISRSVLLNLLNNALTMYEFFNDQLTDIELDDLVVIQNSVYDSMFSDSNYIQQQLLNDSLLIDEPVYKEDTIDEQDFMSWLIENDHIKVDESTGQILELPPLSEETIEERNNIQKKYEQTQELICNYIRNTCDDQQLHWMRIK